MHTILCILIEIRMATKCGQIVVLCNKAPIFNNILFFVTYRSVIDRGMIHKFLFSSMSISNLPVTFWTTKVAKVEN